MRTRGDRGSHTDRYTERDDCRHHGSRPTDGRSVALAGRSVGEVTFDIRDPSPVSSAREGVSDICHTLTRRNDRWERLDRDRLGDGVRGEEMGNGFEAAERLGGRRRGPRSVRTGPTALASSAPAAIRLDRVLAMTATAHLRAEL